MLSYILKLPGRIFRFALRRPFFFLLIVAISFMFLTFVTYQALHYTSRAEFCANCHPAVYPAPLSEYDSWSRNVHAVYNVSCIDCHTIQPGVLGYLHSKVVVGGKDLIQEVLLTKEEKIALLEEIKKDPILRSEVAPENVCLFCHSDEVNQWGRESYTMSVLGLTMRGLDEVKNPEYRNLNGMIDIKIDNVSVGVEPNHKLHLEFGVSCSDCHISVAHTGEFKTKLDMKTCFDCHDRSVSDTTLHMPKNDDCVSCHITQEAFQQGDVASSFGIEKTVWEMDGIGCYDCHGDGFTKISPTICADCHDDSFVELYQEQKAEFEEKFAHSFNVYKKFVSNLNKMDDKDHNLFLSYKKLFNILDKDRSKGAHNPNYAADIFAYMEKIENDLKAYL